MRFKCGRMAGKVQRTAFIADDLAQRFTRGPPLRRHELVALNELGYLPFARSGGQLRFHQISKLYEQTSVLISTVTA